jgi:hypothetical protein
VDHQNIEREDRPFGEQRKVPEGIAGSEDMMNARTVPDENERLANPAM